MQRATRQGWQGRSARGRRHRLGVATVATVLLHAAALGGAGSAAEPRPATARAGVEVRWVPARDAAPSPEPVPADAAPMPLPAEAIGRTSPPGPAAPRRLVPSARGPAPASAQVRTRKAQPGPTAAAPLDEAPSAQVAVAPSGEAPPGEAPLDKVPLDKAPPGEAPPERVAAAPRSDADASPAPAAPAAADAPTVPHYPTHVPPSVTLRYDVRRGMLSGVGEIAWRSDGAHYELKLDFRYAGISILQQTSSGGFDADGLAPLRYVDQRIRRSAQAANFRRELGQLSYSGSDQVHGLAAGTQDRLSWMVQLAAIVSADPALARPGGRVTMAVTGARGDLDVWTFRSLGTEALELRSGRVEAAKFTREPRDEHDLTINAWLDPARHYLPVGAFQQAGRNDEAYELRLVEATDGR